MCGGAVPGPGDGGRKHPGVGNRLLLPSHPGRAWKEGVGAGGVRRHPLPAVHPLLPQQRHQQRHPQGRHRLHQRLARRLLAPEDPFLQVASLASFFTPLISHSHPFSLPSDPSCFASPREKIIFNYPDATVVTGTFWAVLRSQMQTIITKACNELGIKAVPSKRVRNFLPARLCLFPSCFY